MITGNGDMNKDSAFTIVAFGDSITEAAQQPEAKRWPVLLQALLTHRFPNRRWQVLNAGVGGNTSREGLARIEPDVLAKRPDHVLVEFGGNDPTFDEKRHVPLDEYERNLEAIKARVASAVPDCRLIMLVFPPVIDAWHVHGRLEAYRKAGGLDVQVERYRQLTREFSARHHLPLADIDVALRRFVRRNEAGEVILPDGVHLTEAGNRVVAEAVLDCLSAEMLTATKRAARM